MVNNNLVDSNMFIRAMVLACDHFMSQDGDQATFAHNSRLMKHFREFDKHVSFVVQLVGMLHVTELTQENVSCLNTSLVILMLSARQGRLPDMLAFLDSLIVSRSLSHHCMRLLGRRAKESIHTYMLHTYIHT